jgi:hypothetical protein
MRLDDITNERFEKILLYKRPVLFTPLRIRHDAVSEGIYKYEVRHDDECTGEIVEIAHGIFVNHWGTILSDHQLRLGPSGRRDIDEVKDIRYLNEPPITVKEYLRECKNRGDKVAER